MEPELQIHMFPAETYTIFPPALLKPLLPTSTTVLVHSQFTRRHQGELVFLMELLESSFSL